MYWGSRKYTKVQRPILHTLPMLLKLPINWGTSELKRKYVKYKLMVLYKIKIMFSAMLSPNDWQYLHSTLVLAGHSLLIDFFLNMFGSVHFYTGHGQKFTYF
jgi:hypothetical protein